jgi:hypothetical protein
MNFESYARGTFMFQFWVLIGVIAGVSRTYLAQSPVQVTAPLSNQ